MDAKCKELVCFYIFTSINLTLEKTHGLLGSQLPSFILFFNVSNQQLPISVSTVFLSDVLRDLCKVLLKRQWQRSKLSFYENVDYLQSRFIEKTYCFISRIQLKILKLKSLHQTSKQEGKEEDGVVYITRMQEMRSQKYLDYLNPSQLILTLYYRIEVIFCLHRIGVLFSLLSPAPEKNQWSPESTLKTAEWEVTQSSGYRYVYLLTIYEGSRSRSSSLLYSRRLTYRSHI